MRYLWIDQDVPLVPILGARAIGDAAGIDPRELIAIVAAGGGQGLAFRALAGQLRGEVPDVDWWERFRVQEKATSRLNRRGWAEFVRSVTT
jgi:hypothetical protein